METLKEEFKVTVHVGTYQNIEIEIFTKYKYTLNELLVKKKCFSIVCEIWRTRVFTGSKLCDVFVQCFGSNYDNAKDQYSLNF